MGYKVNESFYEDHLAEIYFFYTGKRNVKGLQHPDASIANDKNYKFIRVGKIKFDLPDITKETCVNETLTIAIENGTSLSNSYKNSIINKVHIFGIVKGPRPVKTTFSCVCTSLMDDSSILDLRLTEESEVINGITEYSVGIWLDVQNVTKIFTTLDNSHSTHTNPMVGYSFSSGYVLELLTENNKKVDENTSNLESYVNSMKFCNSVNKYQSLLDRIYDLEHLPHIIIQTAVVNYDLGFSPIHTGNDAKLPQIITPTNIDFGLDKVPFISLSTADQYFTGAKEGIYMIQLCSKITSNTNTTEKVKVFVTTNTDETISLNYNPYKLKEIGDSMNSSACIVSLRQSDIIRLKFQFSGTPLTDITNGGTTVKITRLQ